MTIGGGGSRCCKYCTLSNGGSLATQRPPRCWASLRHHENTRCKANTCSCEFPQQLLLPSTKFPLPYHWRSTFWADHAMNPAGGIFFHTLECRGAKSTDFRLTQEREARHISHENARDELLHLPPPPMECYLTPTGSKPLTHMEGFPLTLHWLKY